MGHFCAPSQNEKGGSGRHLTKARLEPALIGFHLFMMHTVCCKRLFPVGKYADARTVGVRVARIAKMPLKCRVWRRRTLDICPLRAGLFPLLSPM